MLTDRRKSSDLEEFEVNDLVKENSDTSGSLYFERLAHGCVGIYQSKVTKSNEKARDDRENTHRIES